MRALKVERAIAALTFSAIGSNRHGINPQRPARTSGSGKASSWGSVAGDLRMKFGQPEQSLFELTEAVTEFASGAAAKLRLQQSKAGQINVFIHTSPLRAGPQYSRNAAVPLRRPTSDTPLMVKAAVAGLEAFDTPGYKYVKAGVMLLDLQDGGTEQHELDLEADAEPSSA